MLATGTGASGETTGAIQLAPGGVPLTFSRVGAVSQSVDADTLDITDWEGNRFRWMGAGQGGRVLAAGNKCNGWYMWVDSARGKA